MDTKDVAYHPGLKPAVSVTGTATEGSAGPAIGLVDIGESEGAYLFRVALPGLKKGSVKCDMTRDGNVHIEGVMIETGLLRKSQTVYQMKVQQLCAAGPFAISFNLPGPVDSRLCSIVFRPDGILEVVVLKMKSPDNMKS